MDHDDVVVADKKQTMCSAWDGDAMVVAGDIDMEALVLPYEDRTFAVVEVVDVVVAACRDQLKAKSYLNIKFYLEDKKEEGNKFYLHGSCIC